MLLRFWLYSPIMIILKKGKINSSYQTATPNTHQLPPLHTHTHNPTHTTTHTPPIQGECWTPSPPTSRRPVSITHPTDYLPSAPTPLRTLPSPLALLSYLIHNPPTPSTPSPPHPFTLPHAPPARHAPFFYGHSRGEEEEDEEAGAFTGNNLPGR